MSSRTIRSLPDILQAHGLRILRNAILAAIVVFAASFLIHDRFTASTLILPPTADDDISGLLGGGAGTAALSRALGLTAENKTDIYLGMLRSRSMSVALLERFHLVALYHKSDVEKAGKVLAAHTKVSLTNEGFLRIAVTENSATLAADIANAYAEELDRSLLLISTHGARLRREFLGTRLAEARDSLAHAENVLRDYQVRNRIPVGGDLLQAAEGVGQLVSEKLSRELELGTLREVSIGRNPRAEQLRAELNEIDRQISKVPAATTDLARLVREAKVQEKIVLVLTEEFERARLMESKNVATVDVVDHAVPPLHKSEPRRTLLAIGAFMTALLASSALYWARDGLRQLP